MAKSCRQQIVEAAFAKLQTLPAFETNGGAFKTPLIELNRRVPLEKRDDGSDLPAAILFEGAELPLNDFSSFDLYDLTLIVQLAADGAGDAAVEWVNTMRAETIKALKADFTLGGIARWLELADAGDFLGAETPAEAEGALLAFTVHYATREGDPYTFD